MTMGGDGIEPPTSWQRADGSARPVQQKGYGNRLKQVLPTAAVLAATPGPAPLPAPELGNDRGESGHLAGGPRQTSAGFSRSPGGADDRSGAGFCSRRGGAYACAVRSGSLRSEEEKWLGCVG